MSIKVINFKSSLLNKMQQKQTVASTPVVTKPDTVELSTKQDGNQSNKTKLAVTGIVGAGLLILAAIKRKAIIKFIQKFFKKAANNGAEAAEAAKQTTKEYTPKIAQTAEKKIPQNTSEQQEILPKNEVKEKLFSIVDNVYYKFVPADTTKEILSSKMYKAANVKVADKNFIGYEYSNKGIKSEYLPNLQNIDINNLDDCKKICEDYIVDVLVANEDILHTCKKQTNGEIVRLKLSKVFGNSKEQVQENLGIFPIELSEYLSPELHPKNTSVYKHLTRETLIDSLKKLKDLEVNEEQYKYALTSSDSDVVIDKIRRRKNFLEKFIQIVIDTPQEKLTIQEYVEKTKNILIEKTIEKTKSYFTLNEVKNAIDKINNKEVKKRLTEIYNAKIINADTNLDMVHYRTEKLLKSNFHKENNISEEAYKKLEIEYGKQFARVLENRLKKSLLTSDLFDATRMMRKLNDKLAKFLQENPDLLVIYLNSNLTKDSQAFRFKETQWQTIINYLKDFVESKIDKSKFIQAIIKYSGFGSYDSINGVLRLEQMASDLIKLTDNTNLDKNNIQYIKHEIKHFKTIADRMIFKNTETSEQELEKIKAKIEELTNFLQNNDLSRDKVKIELQTKLKDFRTTVQTGAKNAEITNTIDSLKLHSVTSSDLETNLQLNRYTRCDSFHSVWIDGKPLDELLMEGLTPELFLKIEKHIENNKIILEQPEFLSTSIAPYFVDLGNVKMNIKMDRGVKYTYTSDIDHMFDYPSERTESELLIHPNHKLEIIKARLENINNQKKLVFDVIVKPKTVK